MPNNAELLSSLRILYVEDDKNAQEEVAFFLEGLVGKLYLASNGEEGLDLYHTYSPDLIITDIQMPVMTGIEMIQKIRQNDRNTPVFITTAYNETNFLLNAINSGVDRYILKPINFKILSDALIEVSLANQNQHFYVTVDDNGIIVEANEAWLHMVGCDRANIIGKPLEACVDPEQKNVLETYIAYLKEGKSPRKRTITLLQENGQTIEAVLYAVQQKSLSDGTVLHQIEMKNLDSYIHDEESLSKALETERFIRTLIKTQSSIHKTIATYREKNLFLQNIVDLFTRNEHFEFAFISLAEDGNKISITAQGTHSLIDMKMQFPEIIDISSLNCPMGEVMEQRKLVVVEDLLSFNDFPSKTFWIEHGIKSMILLPIVPNHANTNTSYHALSLLLSKTYKLDKETLELFENISDSISLGLKAIEDRIERTALQAQLRQERDFMNGILQTAGNVIAVIDRSGSIVRFNKAAEDVTGYTFAEIAGQPFFWKNFLLHEDQDSVGKVFESAIKGDVIPRYENVWVSKDGKQRLFDWTNTLLLNENGETEYLVTIGNDITERKKNEEIIEHLAFYDPLTHLANRRLLGSHLTKAMAMSRRSGNYGAVMFLDLDNFKPLNDTYGHRMGDMLLIEAAQRIKNSVRECDTVARFGGDEFVVLLRELSEDRAESIKYAHLVAEKIRNALAEHYFLKISSEDDLAIIVEHQCTSSIGIALFYKSDVTQDDVLRWADTAMYEAKDAGRNRIAFHKDSEKYSF